MNLRPVFLILFVFVLEACSRVPIKNAEWCADMGPYGASCVKTLSDDQREIPKEIWDQLEIGPDHRFGMVCTDPANFADWKKAILKLCYLTKACTYNVKTKVVQFADKMESFTISMEKNYVLKEAESTTEDGEEEEGTYARVGDSEVPNCHWAGEEAPTCDY
jgi:hypothetical protein